MIDRHLTSWHCMQQKLQFNQPAVSKKLDNTAIWLMFHVRLLSGIKLKPYKHFRERHVSNHESEGSWTQHHSLARQLVKTEYLKWYRPTAVVYKGAKKAKSFRSQWAHWAHYLRFCDRQLDIITAYAARPWLRRGWSTVCCAYSLPECLWFHVFES